MEIVATTRCWSRPGITAGFHIPPGSSILSGTKVTGIFPARKIAPSNLYTGFGDNIKAFANNNSVKKLRRNRGTGSGATLQTKKKPSDEDNGSAGVSQDDFIRDRGSSGDTFPPKVTKSITSRSVVLRACAITSGLILALGVAIRQVSHIASLEGWPILDCSTEVSFDFEMWHLELIAGLVVLISSCRYLLLKTWADFAESSEAANQQVLSGLQPLDFMVVAFLPGVSEELLFRGALLPLFGFSLKSALAVAVIFGLLHLNGGRRYPFAMWATFVGFAYGYSAIVSSSIIVPMASHALNNLIGGILWRYTSTSEEMD
ncbi:PREDICTED: uncharacterized protein LOC104591591 isoform X2 [Nelumbo nucifera]|uniref:Uncharacterized protein LOC104591591 isoform X2 n=1 Tax=Nelumbo nucifera TaxID=4432 RepID=A0A1U7ZC57_NELNU|nr:PREDICTED: uncharacterized protein LOC104591591 isoform X2 [Nelumbo nucifera]